MNRFLGFVVGCIAVLGLMPIPAQACTCLTSPSPSGGAQAVDVVFVGKVANIEHIEADGWLYGSWKSMLGAEHLYEFETLRVSMDVSTAIKGTDKSQLTLENSRHNRAVWGVVPGRGRISGVCLQWSRRDRDNGYVHANSDLKKGGL